MLVDGMSAWIRGATSAIGGPRRRKVEEFICRIFGDGRCDLGSEPEVRFVFHHVSDKEGGDGRKGEFVQFET